MSLPRNKKFKILENFGACEQRVTVVKDCLKV